MSRPMMKVPEIDKICTGDVIAGIGSQTCFILWGREFQSTERLTHPVRDESPQTIEPR
jgi:hypothetical protein